MKNLVLEIDSVVTKNAKFLIVVATKDVVKTKLYNEVMEMEHDCHNFIGSCLDELKPTKVLSDCSISFLPKFQNEVNSRNIIFENPEPGSAKCRNIERVIHNLIMNN